MCLEKVFCCRSRHTPAASQPPLSRGEFKDSARRIEPQVLIVFSYSPLERGASSTFFKSLEEAGCVPWGYVVRLDKMLKLVTFVPVPDFFNLFVPNHFFTCKFIFFCSEPFFYVQIHFFLFRTIFLPANSFFYASDHFFIFPFIFFCPGPFSCLFVPQNQFCWKISRLFSKAH
jgi:hypothetical protein